MVKKTLLISVALSVGVVIGSAAQQMIGFQTSNYVPAYRVSFNPSAIVGTHDKWNINLITAGGTVNSRYFKYFLSDALFHPFRATYTTSEIYGKTKLTGSYTDVPNINLAAELRLPSAYFCFGENNRFGLGVGTRLRGLTQATGVPAALAEVYTKRLDYGDIAASSGRVAGMSFNQNSFFELSLSAAAVLLDIENVVRLKIGGTVKRLSGARNFYFNLNNAQYQVRQVSGDDYALDLTNASVEYGYSREVGSFSLGALGSSEYGSGWAIDAGATLEIGKIRNDADYRLNYLIRLGAAITDAGSISYPTTGKRYSGTVNRLSFSQDQLIELASDPVGTLEKRVGKPNAKAYDLTTTLPQTLNLDADVQFFPSFFINATLIQPNATGSLPTYLQQPRVFAITPRFEDADFQFTLPISWIEGNASPIVGFSFRMGPAFIGFSNFSGMLKIHQPRGTFGFIGLQLWGLSKKGQ